MNLDFLVPAVLRAADRNPRAQLDQLLNLRVSRQPVFKVRLAVSATLQLPSSKIAAQLRYLIFIDSAHPQLDGKVTEDRKVLLAARPQLSSGCLGLS